MVEMADGTETLGYIIDDHFHYDYAKQLPITWQPVVFIIGLNGQRQIETNLFTYDGRWLVNKTSDTVELSIVSDRAGKPIAEVLSWLVDGGYITSPIFPKLPAITHYGAGTGIELIRLAPRTKMEVDLSPDAQLFVRTK